LREAPLVMPQESGVDIKLQAEA